MVQSLVQASRFLKDELNALYGFFTILSDILGLTKSALLLGSATDRILKPCCIKGFDETTIVQLRVKRNDLVFPNRSYYLGSPSALPFAPLFSSKDYGTMDRLMVLPIYCGDNLNGILFLADNPYLEIPVSELEMIFRPIQDLFRQIIENHLELCHVSSALESIKSTEIKRSTDLYIKMFDQIQDGRIIDFSYRPSAAYLVKEYPTLIPEAAFLDMRLRLLNNLRLYIRAIFNSPGHCFVWLKNEAVGDIDGLIRLCAIELSRCMISDVDYADNIAACMKVIPMSMFLDEIQSSIIQ